MFITEAHAMNIAHELINEGAMDDPGENADGWSCIISLIMAAPCGSGAPPLYDPMPICPFCGKPASWADDGETGYCGICREPFVPEVETCPACDGDGYRKVTP